ncbi:hypothetical protein D7W82_35725 [Corallococcus sp. CA049B]|nr:hypothetical protein D7W82_35725 [Corallococcus sp. CA049B]
MSVTASVTDSFTSTRLVEAVRPVILGALLTKGVGAVVCCSTMTTAAVALEVMVTPVAWPS